MNRMTAFFGAIDTPGGHMTTCCWIIVFGIGAHLFLPGDQLIHDLVVGATGVLYSVMKGQNGSRVTVTPKDAPAPDALKP